METKRFETKSPSSPAPAAALARPSALRLPAKAPTPSAWTSATSPRPAPRRKRSARKFNAYTEDFGKLTQKAAADLVAKIVKDAGRVDILVNNAGIIRRAPVVDHPEADWNAAIQINLTAPFFLSQAVAKWWLTGGREKSPADARLKVVNIASMLSFQGGILVPGYTASKSGIAGITKALCQRTGQGTHRISTPWRRATSPRKTRGRSREDAKRNQAILDRIPEAPLGFAGRHRGGGSCFSPRKMPII